VTKTLSTTIPDPSSGFRITTTSPPGDATVGTPYSYSFSTSSGAASFWFGSADAFDAVGLSFDPLTGTISGNPTASASFTFTVGTTDTGAAPRPNSLVEASLTILPEAGFGIATTSLPDLEPNVPYSATLLPVGGTGPFEWTVDGSSPDVLPFGLNLGLTTGIISGTSNNVNFRIKLLIQIKDTSSGFTRLGFLILKQRNSSISISTGGGPGSTPTYVMQTATQGVIYPPNPLPVSSSDQDLSQADMLTGFSLPTGLSMDAARRLVSGTPTVPGRYALRLQLTDAMGNGGGIQETVPRGEDRVILEVLQAAGFRVTTRTLHTGREGSPYSTAVITQGGTTAAYSFAVTSGALPPGLTLDSINGTLTGTPTAAGTYLFEISVTQGSTVKMAYELPIDPALALAIVTDRLPDAPIGAPYNVTLDAAGSGTITWSDLGSPTTFVSLGLSLNTTTGVVTGAPTAAAGFYTVRVTATNGTDSSTRMVGVLIEPLPITALGFSGAGFVGLAASITPEPFGGTAPYTVTLAPGELLPPGLALTSNVVSGTPTVGTAFSQLLVQIQDNTGRIGFGRLEFLIAPADLPALGIGLSFNDRIEVQVGDTLAAGDHTFDAQGGTSDYTFDAPLGAQRPDDLVPPGMSVSTAPASPGTGNLVGTLTTSGLYTFILRVTDSVPATADQIVEVLVRSFNDGIVPTVDTMRIPDGTASVAYPPTQLRGFLFSGNTDTWTLPVPVTGITLSSTGVVSSTGLAAGTYSFIVRHTDTTASTFAEGRIKLVIR
jgi:hypothetical protein